VKPAIRSTLPAVLALLLGYGLMQMGNTLQGTLLTIRVSPTEIGAVGAGFWACVVIGSLRGGMLIRRVFLRDGHQTVVSRQTYRKKPRTRPNL
jgi:hypothetical protein